MVLYMNLDSELVHLARMALSSRPQDIQLYISRLSRKLRNTQPNVSKKLESLIRESPSKSSPIRSTTMDAIPVDRDSRLNLIRYEYPVQIDIEPIWTQDIQSTISQAIAERSKLDDLLEAGLSPTKAMLFFGLPGLGKTLAARWIALKLDLPLLILDLSAVMSSYLGRTGNNVRNVFDYAKGTNCVLLLDELDAIAKRRDDGSEIGELKRLVTVLLQEIDDWPSGGLLLSATNHPKLLDPAVWRRFDLVVEFPMPSEINIKKAIRGYLNSDSTIADKSVNLLSILLKNKSYSEIESTIIRIRRQAVINQETITESIMTWVEKNVDQADRSNRCKIAIEMIKTGYSQRQASEITKVSRDTIRKKHKEIKS